MQIGKSSGIAVSEYKIQLSKKIYASAQLALSVKGIPQGSYKLEAENRQLMPEMLAWALGEHYSARNGLFMENKMTEEQAQAGRNEQAENQKSPAGNPHKKKASWVRTILWMLSMMLLVNVIMAIIAYVLYRYKII